MRFAMLFNLNIRRKGKMKGIITFGVLCSLLTSSCRSTSTGLHSVYEAFRQRDEDHAPRKPLAEQFIDSLQGKTQAEIIGLLGPPEQSFDDCLIYNLYEWTDGTISTNRIDGYALFVLFTDGKVVVSSIREARVFYH